MERIFQMQLGGRELVVETGKYAEQAGGSCLVRMGDTVVLVCATVAKNARDGVDFLPLSVEYQEKLYAVGKIPGDHQARRSSDRPRHSRFPTDRPPPAAAVPQGIL